MNFRKAKIKNKIGPGTGFDSAYCEVVKTYYESIIVLIETIITSPLAFANKIRAVIKQVETYIYNIVKTELLFIEEQLIKIAKLREFDENIKRKQFCNAAYNCKALLDTLELTTGKNFNNNFPEFEKWICKNFAKSYLDSVVNSLLSDFSARLSVLRTQLEDSLKLDELIAEYNEILNTYYPNPGTEEPENIPGLVEDIIIYPNDATGLQVSWSSTKIYATNGITYDITPGTSACDSYSALEPTLSADFVMNYLVWDESLLGTTLTLTSATPTTEFICGNILTQFNNIFSITATPKTELTLNPNNPGLNFTPPISTWNGKIYDWLGLLDTFANCFFSVCEFAATSNNKKIEYENKLLLDINGNVDFSGITDGITKLQEGIEKQCDDLNSQINTLRANSAQPYVDSAVEKTMNFPKKIASNIFD